ncbi:hypothetical protein HYT54_04125, partial [Candidatus Woesearchaeota archaeon]|nr:hypothetical protein [Candidatus Woesearchaeota archaeon]
MKKEIFLKSKAILMMALIILFPLSLNSPDASAAAGDITDFYIKGQNSDINGYTREDDRIVFVVNIGDSVAAADDDALANKIGIYGWSDQFGFDGCTAVSFGSGTGKDCILTIPRGTEPISEWDKVLLESSNPYTARLFDSVDDRRAGRSVRDSRQASILVDEAAPQFDSANGLVFNQRTSTISYNVNDRLCNSGCIGQCSGLKEISFYLVSIDQATSNAVETPIGETVTWTAATPETCTRTETFAVPQETIDSLQPGTYTIKAVVKDRVGHETTKSVDVLYDNEAPLVTNGNEFTLLTNDGIEVITRHPTSPIPAKLVVSFDSDDVVISSVKGIFTELNPSLTEELPGSCTAVNTGTSKLRCEWDISLNPGDVTDSDFSIAIKAEDNIGNK